MSESHPTRCPQHAFSDSDDKLDDWPCPADCWHFEQELLRRVHEVKVRGNYVSLETDDDGVMWRQVYRNHRPVGERTLWRWHGKASPM